MPPLKANQLRINRHTAACRYLMAADPIMHRLIERIGPCELVPRRGAFALLCHAIISQQLSIAVATTIFDRLTRLYPNRRLKPEAVAATSIPALRAAGLSVSKARYIHDLAQGFLDGRIRPRGFSTQSNEEIIATLTNVKGIGRWTDRTSCRSMIWASANQSSDGIDSRRRPRLASYRGLPPLGILLKASRPGTCGRPADFRES